MFEQLIIVKPRGANIFSIVSKNTVEPLNKGQLRTDGMVPYSEVVLIGRFFRKRRIITSNHH